MALFKAQPAGTIVGTTDTQTLTNKTISGLTNTVSQILGSKTIATTRDMEAASGVVAYTGVGFKPRAIMVFAGRGDSLEYNSVGVSDVEAASSCMMFLGTSVSPNVNFIVLSNAGFTALQSAVVTSYDADGFTLTWTKTGSPSAGNAILRFICFQ